MRRLLCLSAVGLLWVLGQSAALARDDPRRPEAKAPEPAACGEYGTSIEFEPTPSDAARKALKEEKLVFVLHVSGHFEDSDFT